MWKPPTSSPSPSGRSNGSRFVSPTMVTRYTKNETGSSHAYHLCCCAVTIAVVDSEPAYRNTATKASAIAIS